MYANIGTPGPADPCRYEQAGQRLTCGNDFLRSGSKPGDVAYCIHGRIWGIIPDPYSLYPLHDVKVIRLDPLLNPILYRRARKALQAANGGLVIEHGTAGQYWEHTLTNLADEDDD